MEFMEILILAILFIFGAILGSFACCQAWRLHYRELGKKSPGKYSVCLSCGKRLTPAENIPVFSWLFQRGKCKKCGAKIGKAEILSELSLGLAFVAIGLVIVPEFLSAYASSAELWYPLLLILFSLLLIISLTIMWILMIYDAKWQKLPTFLLTFLNACAIMVVILRIVGCAFGGQFTHDLPPLLCNLVGAVAILGGTYFLLYFFSKEKLVGGGDWLVALAIAFLLGDWWLALIALFLANFLGSIYGIVKRVRTGSHQISFAPFLVIAFVLTFTFQNWLLTLVASL